MTVDKLAYFKGLAVAADPSYPRKVTVNFGYKLLENSVFLGAWLLYEKDPLTDRRWAVACCHALIIQLDICGLITALDLSECLAERRLKMVHPSVV